MISGLDVVQTCRATSGADPSWFALPIVCTSAEQRTRVVGFLEESGVETRPLVTGNFARQPVAKRLGLELNELPGAEKLHWCALYVGLAPTVSEANFARLLDVVSDLGRVLN